MSVKWLALVFWVAVIPAARADSGGSENLSVSLKAVFEGKQPVTSLTPTFKAAAKAGNGILRGLSEKSSSEIFPLSPYPEVQRHLEQAQAHESRAWGFLGGTLGSMAVAGAAMAVMAWGPSLSAASLAILGTVSWVGIIAAIAMGIGAIYSHAASRDAKANAYRVEQELEPPPVPPPPEQSHEEWLESVGSVSFLL